MSVSIARTAASFFSMKLELKTIAAVILSLFLLMIGIIFLLTQLGISLISGALVTNDPQTLQVEIHDPATGLVIDHVAGPAIWPVAGPVSLEFGQSDLPYQPFHTGIDIASPNHQVGDPVGAFMAGTVTYADSLNWGFGTHVIIDHGQHVASIYGHLNNIAVQVGDHVDVGEIIGTRGTTGWSTGPHLHFQINVFGLPVNPRVFLAGNP